MKKWLILFTLCSFLFASPIQDRTIDPAALSELAIGLGIPQDADLIAETQKRWLRKSNQERWEVAELSVDQRLFVLNWAQEQKLFSPWKPALKTYDKALILGATTSRMQLRLDYLKQLWNEGVRFGQIVWLTGERPLDSRVDALTDRCSNESEAAHILWEETPLPEEMRTLPLLFVSVPMKGSKRPNTEDTLTAWLQLAPEPCQALFLSDQPFCGYQFAVIKSVLPEDFSFDLAGQGVDPSPHPTAAAITLDSIARWIYQENLTNH
jgi:hypothetical protein